MRGATLACLFPAAPLHCHAPITASGHRRARELASRCYAGRVRQNSACHLLQPPYCPACSLYSAAGAAGPAGRADHSLHPFEVGRRRPRRLARRGLARRGAGTEGIGAVREALVKVKHECCKCARPWPRLAVTFKPFCFVQACVMMVIYRPGHRGRYPECRLRPRYVPSLSRRGEGPSGTVRRGGRRGQERASSPPLGKSGELGPKVSNNGDGRVPTQASWGGRQRGRETNGRGGCTM